MASWPYDERDAPIAEPNAPSWECPEGLCDCNKPGGKGERYEFSVMLFNPEGERMAGARCRVVHQGHVINDGQPYADDSGWVTAAVPHLPASVLVEWAPHDTPRKRPYPFRKWYHVDLECDGEEAARRRLHNLGYSRARSLTANVMEFQRAYGYERISGKVEDIEADLLRYHDDGSVPERRLTGRFGDYPDERVASLPQGGEANPEPSKVPPQKPAGKPPTLGATKIGTGSAMFPLAFKTVVQALTDGEAYHEFVRVLTDAVSPAAKEAAAKAHKKPTPDLAGIFWIFGEALVWEIPDSDDWKNWEESYNPLPANPQSFMGKGKPKEKLNRRRLCRLPCDAMESQAAADMITMAQADLLKLSSDIMVEKYPPKNDAPLPSVLPTPKLYDALYLGADVRIKYQYVDGLVATPKRPTRPIVDMSNEYQVRVNRELMAAFNKSSQTTPPRSLGTPGKIWAAHENMEQWQWERDGHYWYRCAINYGFHEGEATPKAHQTPGSAHPTTHKDYSQILILVAGWCLVMGPGDQDFVWKPTAEVLLSDKFAPLVNLSGKPLQRYRYEGTNRGPMPTGKGPYWTPQQ